MNFLEQTLNPKNWIAYLYFFLVTRRNLLSGWVDYLYLVDIITRWAPYHL